VKSKKFPRMMGFAAAFIFSAVICIFILPAKVSAEDWITDGLTAAEATVTITDMSAGTLTVPAGMDITLGSTSAPAGNLTLLIAAGSTVTFSGNIPNTMLIVEGAGDLTLQGGTLDSVYYKASGTLTLSGTQIDSDSNGIIIENTASEFVMTGGSVKSGSTSAIYIISCSSATFTAGTIDSTSAAGEGILNGATSSTIAPVSGSSLTVKCTYHALTGTYTYSNVGLITMSTNYNGTGPTYAVGTFTNSASYKYVVFERDIPEFSLTVENGTGSDSTVEFGSQVNIEATVPQNNEFVRWTVTGGSYTFDDDTAAAQTITMPYGNLTLTPVFSEIAAPSTPPSSSDSANSSGSSGSEPVSSEPVAVTAIPVLAAETTPEEYVPPKVIIEDDTPIVIGDKEYAGTVKVESVNSDTPQEIPKEVIIDGEYYAVGDTVYIVGTEEKTVEATAETGFSYVFTAVENSDNPVKFTAEGLPDGLEMSEDGVITTKTLPAPVGTFEITVIADNGADTSEYKMTIVINESELSDTELLEAIRANDVPGLLSEPQEDIHNMWVNEELSIHYEPEIDDFYALFLDGKLLTPETDYRLEEGSTVIILTEQTMASLPSGDHVVTTMFNKGSDVGLDTVINDVGSSSFVFRFGDDKTEGMRVNIGGDGVSGSVTFDDTNSKEEPITTITANTKSIEERAQKLSNATGKEIIAAFETAKHGGFSSGAAPAGRIATFAVSVKSLDLKLKDGASVYVAVYDSTTGKTYQNKGEVKDGMIVFRTKHSGVFMVSLEKF
jgi:hypothetical protein